MTKLTPLALQNADVLRALRAGEHTTNKGLARALGKDPTNLRNTLKLLEGATLIAAPDGETGAFPALTELGVQALAAIARAEDETGVAASPPPSDLIALKWAQITPSVMNPRRDWDSDEATEALSELADSIARDDLLQNLVVRPLPADDPWHDHLQVFDDQGRDLPIYEIVAGERRWRAIRSLVQDGRWPDDKPVPCRLVQLDDAGHARVAIIENLKRRDLKPLEEARAFKALRNGDQPMSTAEIAEAIHSTQRLVQQRLQLLELSEADQTRLDEGRLTIEQARQIIANKPAPVELSADATLIFLEIADRVARIPKGNLWSDVTIGWDLEEAFRSDDHPAKELRPFVSVRENWQTAHSQASFHYATQRLLLQLTGDDRPNPKAIESPLRHARLQAIGGLDARANPLSASYIGQHQVLEEWEARGEYLTPGLNAPFTRSPDRVKDLEDRTARDAADRERRRSDQAEREAQEAKRVEAAQRLRQIAEKPEAHESSQLVDALSRYGAPLPWRLKPSTEVEGAQIVDANGNMVDFDPFDDSECWDHMQALLMAAMNSFAGMAPEFLPVPDPSAAEEDADGQDEAEEDLDAEVEA